jgi:hypothetical protein
MYINSAQEILGISCENFETYLNLGHAITTLISDDDVPSEISWSVDMALAL